jgi:hypothetical protein
MKQFRIATIHGPGQTIKYHPLIYTRMTGIYSLALHRVNGPRSPWKVSDPVSGYGMRTLTATWKGVPVSSECMTVKQAREAALAELDALVDRLGFERFDATIQAARREKTTNKED